MAGSGFSAYRGAGGSVDPSLLDKLIPFRLDVNAGNTTPGTPAIFNGALPDYYHKVFYGSPGASQILFFMPPVTGNAGKWLAIEDTSNFHVLITGAESPFTLGDSNSNKAVAYYHCTGEVWKLASVVGMPSFNAERISNKDQINGYVGLDGFQINFKNLLGNVISLFRNSNTTQRIYTFQDRDGTIADNTDLANTLISANTYTDTRVSAFEIGQGNFDASTNTYPTSANVLLPVPGGAIKKGYKWRISVAGTPTGFQALTVGDELRALVDNPGTTPSNWAALEGNLGYSPENIANKNQANGYAGLDGAGNFVQNSDKLGEGATNKYWTNARTIASTLTGFAASAYSAITSADSILTALQKIAGLIGSLSTVATTGAYSDLTGKPSISSKIPFSLASINASGSAVAFPRVTNSGGSNYPTTVSGGISGANVDPIVLGLAGTITKVWVKIYKAGVSQSSVGSTPTVRIDIYDNTKTSRSLIGTARVVLSPTGVGVFSTPSDCYQYAELTVSLAVSAGKAIGLELVPENSDNNKINCVETCYAGFIYEI